MLENFLINRCCSLPQIVGKFHAKIFYNRRDDENDAQGHSRDLF
jgi:hypothetical protein